MATVDPEFEANTRALAQVLDQLDYFQVLKVPEDAGAAEIREAFHRETRAYHPDRYHALPASPFKADVQRIFKRVTEAYVVLRDEPKRRKYAQDVKGEDRARKLRFTDLDESQAREQQKRAQEEQIGLTVKGRQLYVQALRDLESSNLAAAQRNLKLASTFEPQNQLFKDKLAEIEAALRQANRRK